MDRHPTPIERVSGLIKLERNDVFVLFAYTLIVGLVSLIVPVAMQALVNTIAAGVALQPELKKYIMNENKIRKIR